MLESILHGIIIALIVYLIIGLIAGLYFIVAAIVHEIWTGNVDHKFGPAWKSGMTYMLAFSMACPVLNFFWAVVIYRDLKKHVWNWLTKEEI